MRALTTHRFTPCFGQTPRSTDLVMRNLGSVCRAKRQLLLGFCPSANKIPCALKFPFLRLAPRRRRSRTHPLVSGNVSSTRAVLGNWISAAGLARHRAFPLRLFSPRTTLAAENCGPVFMFRFPWPRDAGPSGRSRTWHQMSVGLRGSFDSSIRSTTE